jgi:hypothetical protein
MSEKRTPRVLVRGAQVVILIPVSAETAASFGTEEGVLEAAGDAETAEELAHALLLCAHAARGHGVTERDEAVVAGMTLSGQVVRRLRPTTH